MNILGFTVGDNREENNSEKLQSFQEIEHEKGWEVNQFKLRKKCVLSIN